MKSKAEPWTSNADTVTKRLHSPANCRPPDASASPVQSSPVESSPGPGPGPDSSHQHTHTHIHTHVHGQTERVKDTDTAPWALIGHAKEEVSGPGLQISR